MKVLANISGNQKIFLAEKTEKSTKPLHEPNFQNEGKIEKIYKTHT